MKDFLRKLWHLCKYFAVVKRLFNLLNNHQQFDLPKLQQYLTCLPGFSRYLENLSLNLSPKRRETLNFPPSRDELGVRGLG